MTDTTALPYRLRLPGPTAVPERVRQALGIALFPRAALSDTVTVMRVPEGLEGGAITRHLYQRYRTVIAGSRTHLSGKLIRIVSTLAGFKAMGAA